MKSLFELIKDINISESELSDFDLDNYIVESDTSDDAILYRMGKYRLAWIDSQRVRGIIKKFNITKSDPRPGIIRYMKSDTVPIMPDKDEIIHRKDWDLDDLVGETERQLLNPDYYTLNKYIMSHMKRKHDILTIFQCSSKKPYTENPLLKYNYLQVFKDFTDFASISNPGIIPHEYCGYYPYRYDEWNVVAEQKIDDSVQLTYKYRIVNMCRLIRFVKGLGYKHVIVVIGNPKKQWIFDEMVKKDIAGASKWLHIITNDNFRSRISKKYSKLSGVGGMFGTRIPALPETGESYGRKLKELVSASEKDAVQQAIDDRDEKIKKNHNHINEGLLLEDYTVKSSISYDDIMKKFKASIKDNMNDPSVDKGDNDMYYKSYYWTALDILLIGLDGDLVEDIDGAYWDLIDNLKKDKDFEFFDKFLFAYKPLMDNDDVNIKDVKKEALDMKIAQINKKFKMPNIF